MNAIAPQCRKLKHHEFGSIRNDLREDICHFLDKFPEKRSASDSAKARLGALLAPQVMCLALYRVAHCLYAKGWHRSATFVSRVNGLIHRVNISPQSCIGPGCFLAHPAGLAFHGTAGRDLTLYAMCVCYPREPSMNGPVTTGPRLGQRVTLGAHAAVVGPVSVGDDVKMAPHARVSCDVPPSVVAISRSFRIASFSPRRAFSEPHQTAG